MLGGLIAAGVGTRAVAKVGTILHPSERHVIVVPGYPTESRALYFRPICEVAACVIFLKRSPIHSDAVAGVPLWTGRVWWRLLCPDRPHFHSLVCALVGDRRSDQRPTCVGLAQRDIPADTPCSARIKMLLKFIEQPPKLRGRDYSHRVGCPNLPEEIITSLWRDPARSTEAFAAVPHAALRVARRADRARASRRLLGVIARHVPYREPKIHPLVVEAYLRAVVAAPAAVVDRRANENVATTLIQLALLPGERRRRARRVLALRCSRASVTRGRTRAVDIVPHEALRTERRQLVGAVLAVEDASVAGRSEFVAGGQQQQQPQRRRHPLRHTHNPKGQAAEALEVHQQRILKLIILSARRARVRYAIYIW
eukprot:SAG31_NODE_2630_length_5350_cov_1.706723_1_plen_369_part_00